MNTVPHLQLVQHIEKAILDSLLDIVITHHPADTNNDHLQTSMACQEAIRLAQRRPEVKPLKELAFAFLGRDSAIRKQAWMALAAPSVLVYGSAVVHGMGYQ